MTIKEIRTKTGLTQKAFAEKLNNDPNYQGEGFGAYIQCVDDDGIID